MASFFHSCNMFKRQKNLISISDLDFSQKNHLSSFGHILSFLLIFHFFWVSSLLMIGQPVVSELCMFRRYNSSNNHPVERVCSGGGKWHVHIKNITTRDIFLLNWRSWVGMDIKGRHFIYKSRNLKKICIEKIIYYQ